MLSIKNLKKSFDKREVLKGINLEINEGDRVGIIGPSGCGKSTLLRCLNLLEVPDSGEIIFNDNKLDLEDDLVEVRKNIGMVFQSFNLFNNMSVLENIILAPCLNKIMTRDVAIKKADKLLKEVDLYGIRDMYPSKISGGQKQRVAIIRALLMNPKIMLFDEPTSALDPEMIGEVTDMIGRVADLGMTMVIVSHEMNFIKNFCNKVVFIDKGVVVEEGSSDDIFNNPKDRRLQEFISKTLIEK
jgi:glutamine ABC transporter ATP-binding protein